MKDRARQWLQDGQPAALVEIVQTKGSVPREAGTRMLVGQHEVLGTVGGGHLELKAIELAREMVRGFGSRAPEDAAEQAVEQHFALGPTLGQCCGGALTLRISRLQADHLARWPAPAPRFTLQLYGAGHVGRAIVHLLAGIDCRVQWIDEREEEFPRGAALPAHIERVCVEPVQAEVANAPPGAFYLVLTHSHDLDLAISEAILQRGDFGYFGLIGSKTKRARFEHRFAQHGIGAKSIERMTCPIGIDGIEGKEPEVVAIGVVAQLLQQSAPHP